MKEITYRPTTNNGKECFRVIVPKDLSDGKRKRLFFDDEKDARAKVRQLNDDREQISSGFHRLDQKNKAKMLIALEKVGGNVDELFSAADTWMASPKFAKPKPLSEVINECVAVKEEEGQSDHYISTLRSSLKSFRLFMLEFDVVNIGDVTDEQIRKWLNQDTFADYTKRGYLINVRTMFSYAVDTKKYCANNPSLLVNKIKVVRKPPGIHTVQQAKTLLQGAQRYDPGLIGYIAPLYFGGHRPNESRQMDDESVRKNVLAVDSKVSKGRRRRFIEINPTLRAWMELPEVELAPRNLKRRMLRLRKKLAPFPWPHDVLRHSFCSYGIPKFGAAKISQWGGHSETIMFDHYTERVEPEEVDKYWDIRPLPKSKIKLSQRFVVLHRKFKSKLHK